jgi:hypothetical protein
MEEFDEVDFKSINKERKKLEKMSSDKYWNEYKGDWKNYLSNVFKYDDEVKPYVKEERVVEVTETHPFGKWI